MQIVVDYIMGNVVKDVGENIGFAIQRRRCPALQLTDLDFADEIALLTVKETNAQILLTTDKQWVLSVGLFANRTKTEYMVIGRPKDPDQQLAIAEGNIARIEDFKYLDSWLKSSNKDFNVRRAQGL